MKSLAVEGIYQNSNNFFIFRYPNFFGFSLTPQFPNSLIFLSLSKTFEINFHLDFFLPITQIFARHRTKFPPLEIQITEKALRNCSRSLKWYVPAEVAGMTR